jgi:hypothetical protein
MTSRPAESTKGALGTVGLLQWNEKGLSRQKCSKPNAGQAEKGEP